MTQANDDTGTINAQHPDLKGVAEPDAENLASPPTIRQR